MAFNPGVGGQPVTVLDEGITLTAAVSSIDFVGAGVTATAVGNDVTVTIGGVGSGTVTSVSVVTANGVSGSVATATTTPAITLTLGAITPTSVNGLTVTTTTGTLTLANGSTLATSGANSITLTSTGATNVTLPTTGTLATTETSTFTPTVTLVGGAGNTVPVYSTNVGRYQKIGNRVFVTVVLSGDGGAEGAGTGVYNVALPVAASASITAIKLTSVGNYTNSTTLAQLNGTVSPSGTTISLVKVQTATTQASLTGDDQNNTTRNLSLNFSYEA